MQMLVDSTSSFSWCKASTRVTFSTIATFLDVLQIDRRRVCAYVILFPTIYFFLLAILHDLIWYLLENKETCPLNFIIILFLCLRTKCMMFVHEKQESLKSRKLFWKLCFLCVWKSVPVKKFNWRQVFTRRIQYPLPGCTLTKHQSDSNFY